MKKVRVKDPAGILAAMNYPKCLDALSENRNTIYEQVTEHPVTLKVITGFYAASIIPFGFSPSSVTSEPPQ